MKNKINNESAVVIEDSLAGIISAKRAGFFVISFIEHEYADLTVQNHEDLLQKFIKK